MKQYCSDFDTTKKWQLNESGIAILPIGATEQHGGHLPLNTDTLTASYFAEFTAQKLDAMLLPAMPFGTSLEHAGFRGSISLKPEVLISFIQNIADELEAQNIRILIIMNGHGGNFAMAPAVRQINRQDRNIKILIINCWEFQNLKTEQPEVHSGEGETSLMLALHKNLVGDIHQKCSNPSLQAESYKQSDLNTFGVGRMSPSGVWGDPSKATLAKGQKQVLEIKKNMIPFIKERIRRIEKDSRYAGAGPVALRELTRADIPLGMKLKEAAHWNQLSKDWEMLLAASQGGNYVALKNGIASGTATTVTYGNRFSWIGMVLVDASIRRSGIGKTLLLAAINYAKSKGTVRLDATPEGKKLYDTLGFIEEFRLTRYEAFSFMPKGELPRINCQKMKVSDLPKIFTKDAPIFGADRSIILRHLHKNKPDLAWVCKSKNKITGYCFGREGSNFTQIGPIIADSQEIAETLLLNALNANKNGNYIIDSLDDQISFNAFIKSLGFQKQRPFIRMYLGRHPFPGQPKFQYLIAGPELG